MSHPLPPRGRPSDEEIALVTAAVEALLTSAPAPVAPTSSAWRFSGRWFAGHPYALNRRPGL